MKVSYSKAELESLETIEQAWDGDFLKIKTDKEKVWLTHPENRQWNGDYTIETYVNGTWVQGNYWFK